jgi:hypothetical protein
MQYTPTNIILSQLILILPSHLRLYMPIGLFPSGFLNKILINFTSPMRATFPERLLLLYLKQSIEVRGPVTFQNDEMFLALRQTAKLEEHPISAVHESLLFIFAATLHMLAIILTSRIHSTFIPKIRFCSVFTTLTDVKLVKQIAIYRARHTRSLRCRKHGVRCAHLKSYFRRNSMPL